MCLVSFFRAGNDLGHYSGPSSPHGQVRGGPPAPNGHPGNAPPTPGASTATKELDDLMASLSEFKVRSLFCVFCFRAHATQPVLTFRQPDKLSFFNY